MSQQSVSAAIALFIANGGRVVRVPQGYAHSRLRWGITCHPTHRIPLGLGIVGRW